MTRYGAAAIQANIQEKLRPLVTIYPTIRGFLRAARYAAMGDSERARAATAAERLSFSPKKTDRPKVTPKRVTAQKIARQPSQVTITPPAIGATIGPTPRRVSSMEKILADSC